MQLRKIRQINVAAVALLVTGFLAFFGGLVIGAVASAATASVVFSAIGTAAIAAALLLSFVMDRVRCPKCGKPFNRPDCTNWLARNFSKTQPHWSCVHCGHGSRNE